MDFQSCFLERFFLFGVVVARKPRVSISSEAYRGVSSILPTSSNTRERRMLRTSFGPYQEIESRMALTYPCSSSIGHSSDVSASPTWSCMIHRLGNWEFRCCWHHRSLYRADQPQICRSFPRWLLRNSIFPLQSSPHATVLAASASPPPGEIVENCHPKYLVISFGTGLSSSLACPTAARAAGSELLKDIEITANKSREAWHHHTLWTHLLLWLQ